MVAVNTCLPDERDRYSEATAARLLSVSDRIPNLSANGIAVQVLSLNPCNPSPEGCRGANDRLHGIISQNPTRFAAWASVPLQNPTFAAEELKRCVTELSFLGALFNNHFRGEHLDDQKFWPIFAAAEALDVPLYIHPAFPTEDSIIRRFRGDYPTNVAHSLGAFGWGWHSDTGLAILRLYFSGLFDKFPKLKIIIGHMGEMLPYQMDRIIGNAAPAIEAAGIKRSLRQVLDENIWITTSGMFSLDPMACLLRAIKRDRIMMSIDYPFSANEQGRKFIENLEQSGMLTGTELEDFAYRNAEKLLGLRADAEMTGTKLSIQK
ncbi:MAG: hypothetical protein CYPHOPRED_002894 [Cyphobasidiales sp. Tagirdzhanova-0007]|nr:MAG: hypothetical protein CYPHOPRED_002894 [Cyphobasidiales sp. Tagirdzhanova-0007]